MDLTNVTRYRRAETRADLSLAPGERFLAGGTWLFSEPNRHITGLVDITSMPWEHLEVTDAGLRIGAPCTIAELVAFEAPREWRGMSLFIDAANALLASFKIWNEATVVGNVCRSYAAAAMVSACATLDGEAEIWSPDGSTRRTPVAGLPTGNGTNSLREGELVRAIDIPAIALSGRTALRKVALAERGRSGAVVTGRVDAGGSLTLVVTAATLTPAVLRFPTMPTPAEAAEAARTPTDFYSDSLGSADWRHHLAGVLASEVVTDLTGQRTADEALA